MFRQQCIEIFSRTHSNYDWNAKEKDGDQIFEEEFNEVQNDQKIFLLEESGAEVTTTQEESKQYISGSEDMKDQDPYEEETNEEDFEVEDVYLEFEPEEIEMQTSKSELPIANRKSYTVEEKLNIIKFAEDNNNRFAARNFNINESSVRCFRRQKEILLKMNPQKKTNRKANPHWPKLEEELKKYVLSASSSPKLKEIKEKALEIAEKHQIEKFSGSNSYIFKFMQRHSLPICSPRPRKNKTN